MLNELLPHLWNSGRFNYSHQYFRSTAQLVTFEGSIPPPTGFLVPNPFSTANSFSVFFSPDVASYGSGTLSDNRERQINFLDDLSLVLGGHQLKLGINYDSLLLKKNGALFQPTYLPSSVADLASTGMAAVSVQSILPGAISYRFFSAYVQDEWKATSRMSLTYGVRWEFNPAPDGRDRTVLAAWANVENPALTALAPSGTSLWKNTFTNFAPRVGVAYSLTKKGDFFLRAGWGIFYDLGTGTASSLTGAFPNSVSQFIPSMALPITDPTSLIPPFSTAPPYNSFQPQGFTRNLKLPYSYEWNVALEKLFAGQQAVSVSYVAQAGERLLRTELLAQPNLNFSPFSFFSPTLNGDSSDYQALQLQYKRPISRGFQALLNYTWAHSIDTNSGDAIPNNSHTVVAASIDRGSSDTDVRHNFSGTLLYSVPAYASGGFLKDLTNGWTLATVVVARTGFPINVVSFLTPIPGAVAERPDLVPGRQIWLTDATAGGGRRLNPNAFVVPLQPRQGTLGRNAIRGFGLSQVDFSIRRDFTLHEQFKLAFQADMFNILNHPNFLNPNGLLDFATFGRSTQMLNQGLGGLSPLYQVGGPRSIQLSLRLTF
jgi:hypothetical protein